ncbi:hypothetical protein L3Q82_018811, partial [Scortum barcoo]
CTVYYSLFFLQDLCPPPPSGVVSDSLSLPSYREYPFCTPSLHQHTCCESHTPNTHTSATSLIITQQGIPRDQQRGNLQEKIRRLELEKGHAALSLHTMGRESSHTRLQSEVTQRHFNEQTGTERAREVASPTAIKVVLITHLAAAESRCVKLERQLDHMRRMLRNAKADRTSLLKQQASMETARSADRQSDTVSDHAQLEKLERLEQEYLRLTRTQNNAEMKIRELEMKLQEEEHQRKLVQDQANQLQTGLEANRILLQSVSPCLSTRESKEKKSDSKKSSPQQSSYTQPHYRLSLRDVPFVAGMSVGCSHSVRANVQSVLSLLKRHQPHHTSATAVSSLATQTAATETGSRRHSDTSSSSSCSSGEELSELLQALQEELRLMSLEQDELMRQVETSLSEQERKELQREQERLLLKMERKGEQISKLYKHKTQIKKLRKEANSRRSSGNEEMLVSLETAGLMDAPSSRTHRDEDWSSSLRLQEPSQSPFKRQTVRIYYDGWTGDGRERREEDTLKENKKKWLVDKPVRRYAPLHMSVCPRQYGFINSCLKSLVVEKFGEETWVKLRDGAGVQDTFLTYEVYKDEITMQLVADACKLLGEKPEVVLRQFGEYFFEFCKRSGYDHMLRTLGGNLFEFTENLDALHSYLALSYKEMNAPSFRVERNPDGTMFLHYYSDRRGLCHIVPGIIGAVAKDFFNSEITMEIVNQLEELERTGKKEHVVFLVKQWPAVVAGPCVVSSKTEPFPRNPVPPAFGEPTLTYMCPLCVSLHQKTSSISFSMRRSHWETIRGLVRLGKGKLLRGFEPVYPTTLNIDLRTFCHAFPFHIVFDEQLLVHQAGVNLQKIVPGLQTMSIHLDLYFSIVHPEVTFTISSIRKFINSHFVLQTRRDMMPEAWRNRPMLQLRGQMIWMPSLNCMLYQASPLLRSLQELEERDMHISDIAPHDVTRDLILLNQQRLAELELSNQLERKKEELRLLSQHLEEERRKTENLLYAMLPKHVANQLKEGKTVEAGEFKECTILFSDVVTFTNICSLCEPIQIVLMLNSMYLRFDRLTTVHNVYKVETIGDAYMVVGGVPIPVSSHAERVANFALGMVLAAREVINPVTGGPIQIRVGLHSGPVLAGVVGEKMPRYCLFGDTVNTASRMESHGLPDKIHLSPTVYQALKNKSYVIQKRGEIEVKGKGRMTTYFLERNKGASEQQIMGLSDVETGAGEQDSQRSCQPGLHRPALQRQCRDDLCLIPMKYEDSQSEPLPSSNTSEPQTSPAIKPRDSESYGSLHTDDQSEDGALNLLKVSDGFGQTEVKSAERIMDRSGGDNHVGTEEQQLITGAVETNNQSKHTRTRFCVVL